MVIKAERVNGEAWTIRQVSDLKNVFVGYARQAMIPPGYRFSYESIAFIPIF